MKTIMAVVMVVAVAFYLVDKFMSGTGAGKSFPGIGFKQMKQSSWR